MRKRISVYPLYAHQMRGGGRGPGQGSSGVCRAYVIEEGAGDSSARTQRMGCACAQQEARLSVFQYTAWSHRKSMPVARETPQCSSPPYMEGNSHTAQGSISIR